MYFKKEILKKTYNFDYSNTTETLDVAYGIDEKFLFGAMISINSLLFNNKDIPFCFHVVTDYINNDYLIKIDQLAQDNQTHIIIYLIDCEFLMTLPSTKNWSYAMYFRLIAFDLCYVPNHKLLYLDADVICKGSIQYFYNVNFHNNIALVVKDGDPSFWSERAETLSNKKIQEGYFNSGVIFIDLDKWHQLKLTSKVINLLLDKKFQTKLKFPDQDALNFLLSGHVHFIDKKFNSQTSINFELQSPKKKFYNHNLPNDTIFIHYIGPTKPWHNWSTGYPINEAFNEAKEQSPWKWSAFQDAKTVSLIRYQAKHYLNQCKYIRGYITYLKYFISKILKN